MDRYYDLRIVNGIQATGKEVFEITPVILGGSPSDPENKTLLTRDQHIKAVVYWNMIVRELRSQSLEGHARELQT